MRLVFFHVLNEMGPFSIPGVGCVPNMSFLGYLGFRQVSCQEGCGLLSSVQWLTHSVQGSILIPKKTTNTLLKP